MQPDVWVSLDELAAELDATVDDIRVVADIELDLDDYDPDAETVSRHGHEQLRTHFRGGADPA